MKLKETFMTSDTIDYFMSQPDGANYVVLYQMLCLKTINTNGKLSRQIGEIIIPYDVEKIQRDCKWFSADTVRVALKLYQAVGLIYEDINGVLTLSDHKNLVGSETDFAAQKKLQRQNKCKFLPEGVDNGVDNVHTDIEKDNRDKILDIRDEDIDDKSDKPTRKRFVPPTLEEVQAYCKKRNNNVDAKQFFDFYDAAKWHDSKGEPVRSWKQKVITWEGRNKDTKKGGESKDASCGYDEKNKYAKYVTSGTVL